MNCQIPTITAESISKILNESSNLSKIPASFLDDDFEKILRPNSKTNSELNSAKKMKKKSSLSFLASSNVSNKDARQTSISKRLAESSNNLEIGAYDNISNCQANIQKKSEENIKTESGQYTQTNGVKNDMMGPFINSTIKNNND